MRKFIAVFTLLLVSLLAHSQSSYYDYSYSQKKKAFYDDFNSDTRNWSDGCSSSGSVSFSGGYMTFSSTSSTSPAGCTSLIDFDDSRDFEIETKFKYISGVDNQALHFVFGKKVDKWSRYDIGYSANGQYLIDKSYNNEYTNIVNWTESSLVKKYDYNTLTVRKVNGRCYYFINKTLVHSMTFKSFYGNEFGFQVPKKTKIRIDYLRLSYLDKDNYKSNSPSNYNYYTSSQKKEAFNDNFTSDSYNWNNGCSSSGAVSFSGGKMAFFSTKEDQAAGCTKLIDFDDSKDFEIETKFKYVRGVDNNALKLVFGKKVGKWSRYNIGYSANGQYIIDYSYDNEYTNIVGWTKSSLVRKLDYNILTVRKVKGKCYFFINKSLVHTMNFRSFYGNEFGFQVPEKTKILIDYLRLSYIGEETHNEVATYNYGPQIIITKPDVSRGFNVVAEKLVGVTGRAKDSDGVYEVTVNGIEASLQTGGYFSANVPLAVGSNTITVKATDVKMKSTTKTFKVSRKSENVDVVSNVTEDVNVATNEKRVALIFGNSNYSGAASLGVNPVNDARDIAATLRTLGFDVVIKTDANLMTMNSAIRDFGRENRDADVALFYFAGHGMQIEQVNYILPVGINIKDKNDVDFECISIAKVQRIMETSNSNRLNLIVLDACRNNPFRTWQRGGESGLADMTPPSGTLIAFATSPGSTASNGSGRNGLYTGELIKQLKTPQRIEDVFINTRVEVEKKSGGQQSPWELARLRGKYYLVK